MTDQQLNILNYALLALLYLFFARVLWAVWSEVRGRSQQMPVHGQQFQRTGPADPTVPAMVPGAVAAPTAALPRKAPRGRKGNVGRLVISQPKARRGTTFAVADEITIGRATTCGIPVPDDTFASQLHARLFRFNGGVWLEDLGSTNGSYVNGRRLTAPEQLAKGDRVQIGNTLFEAE